MFFDPLLGIFCLCPSKADWVMCGLIITGSHFLAAEVSLCDDGGKNVLADDWIFCGRQFPLEYKQSPIFVEIQNIFQFWHLKIFFVVSPHFNILDEHRHGTKWNDNLLNKINLKVKVWKVSWNLKIWITKIKRRSGSFHIFFSNEGLHTNTHIHMEEFWCLGVVKVFCPVYTQVDVILTRA